MVALHYIEDLIVTEMWLNLLFKSVIMLILNLAAHSFCKAEISNGYPGEVVFFCLLCSEKYMPLSFFDSLPFLVDQWLVLYP